jgi:hypothetical protein
MWGKCRSAFFASRCEEMKTRHSGGGRGRQSCPTERCPTEIKDEIGMASVEIPGELSLERRRECRREDG